MTRVTSFGRKRTHVEATFNYHEDEGSDDAEAPLVGVTDEPAAVVMSIEGVEAAEVGRSADGQPPKKKRKRGPRKKAGIKVAAGTGDSGEGGEKEEVDEGRREKNPDESPEGKGRKKRGKWRTIQERKEASEKRRRRRIAERNVNTICFACREKGHAVQDCPKIADGSIKPSEAQSGFGATGVVGICYRCGSRKHRLSACRAKAPDPSNPLPFASCFVCNGNGHLASQCAKNKEKGVYPNGGSCKLCGETDHLARNCKLGDKAVLEKTTFLGTGTEAGADEDDFHSSKRKYAGVEKEQKTTERVQKSGLRNQAQPQMKKVVKF